MNQMLAAVPGAADALGLSAWRQPRKEGSAWVNFMREGK